jgi:ABC-type sugar transport system ATPase subunit
MSAPALLDARGIRKNFGAVEALRGVDLRIARGETVAIVGDNGAGKSTLVKIFSGVLRPTAGEIRFDDKPVDISSPDVARQLGIETVYQDLGLCENMSVADNVFLGREMVWKMGPLRFLDKKAMHKATQAALTGLSVNVPRPDATVSRLSGGQRQAIALARAKLWERELVLLDEPTAALGVQEGRRAMQVIRDMQEHGLSIVIISHNMPLVLELSQRVVVLRHGRKVGDVQKSKLKGDDIVALITGARDQWIEAA